MQRSWGLIVLLIVGSAQAASTLSLKQLVGTGYITGLQCFAKTQDCEGSTPLAANAFASALGLPAPTATRNSWWAWDTAGRGWRVQHQQDQGAWTVRLTPLGRRLSAAELGAYPEPRPVVLPPPALPAPKSRPQGCTVVVDVRGLGRMDRDMTSIVFDTEGQRLWPDAGLVRGTANQLVLAGNLHTYVTSEAQLAGFQNVTRVKAFRLQAPRIAPNSSIRTDAVLGPNAAREFRSAGSACRVVYLLAP